MKKVEYKSPETLKALTDQSRQEISLLIRNLKNKKPKNLDDFVHGLHDEAFADFDCLGCANCCKTIGPRLRVKDIDRLARQLKMKTAGFLDQYVTTDDEGDWVFRDHPCPFLMDDNYCMVYANRPKACRDYPHTNRKRFYQILTLSHKNCETCPVVYEIFETLREEKHRLW